MKQAVRPLLALVSVFIHSLAHAAPVLEVDGIPSSGYTTPHGSWTHGYAGTFQGYLSQSFIANTSVISGAAMYLGVRAGGSTTNEATLSIRSGGVDGAVLAQKNFTVAGTQGWQGVTFDAPINVTNGGEYYLRLDDADGHTDTGAGDFVDVAAHFSQSPPTIYSSGMAYINTSAYSNSDLNFRIYASGGPPTVPGAPTIGTATGGNAQATVAFTAPANDGGAAITGYTATSAPGGLTGSCGSSPCTVAGLTNGTAYTFTVVATNSEGNSPASSASNPVTPGEDSDGDGILDNADTFPADPIEDNDADGDGIGDNGDAGGTGIGIRVLDAPLGCAFGGPVENNTAHLDTAPGKALDKQLNFTLTGCGASVTIEALFGEDLPPRSVAYKVSASGEWVKIPGATIAGNKITYTVTDNGPLDDDAVPGQITDPVTAVVPPIEPVPVLPVWLLAALGSLIGLAGLRHYSR